MDLAKTVVTAMNNSPATSEALARKISDALEKMLDTAAYSIERKQAKAELSLLLLTALHRGLEES